MDLFSGSYIKLWKKGKEKERERERKEGENRQHLTFQSSNPTWYALYFFTTRQRARLLQLGAFAKHDRPPFIPKITARETVKTFLPEQPTRPLNTRVSHSARRVSVYHTHTHTRACKKQDWTDETNAVVIPWSSSNMNFPSFTKLREISGANLRVHGIALRAEGHKFIVGAIEITRMRKSSVFSLMRQTRLRAECSSSPLLVSHARKTKSQIQFVPLVKPLIFIHTRADIYMYLAF